jgi:tetratricopeptide (TPR) repeat protein
MIKIAGLKFYRKEYQEVVNILKKADKNLESEESVVNKNYLYSITRCHIYLELGKATNKLKDSKTSLEFLNRCYEEYRKGDIHDEYLLAMLHEARGNSFKKICDNFRALEEYEKSYNILRNIQPHNTEEKAKCMKHLGNLHHLLSNHERALDFYKKAIESKRELIGKEADVFIIDCLLNLGIIYQKESKYILAREHFEKALLLEKELNGSETLNVGIILINLGKTVGSLGNIKVGIHILDEALNILKKCGKGESIQAVNCIYEKGVLYENYGDKKRAKEVFTNCLQQTERVPDSEGNLVNLVNELKRKLESGGMF